MNLRVTARKSTSTEQTLKLMRAMVERYKLDMLPWARMSPLQAFRAIANLPWLADKWNGVLAEVIKRPGYTMLKMWPGGDCDDKAVALASVFELQGRPWRFVAAGKTPGKPPTHVFTEALFGDRWITMDATYPFNRAGLPMRQYPVQVRG